MRCGHVRGDSDIDREGGAEPEMTDLGRCMCMGLCGVLRCACCVFCVRARVRVWCVLYCGCCCWLVLLQCGCVECVCLSSDVINIFECDKSGNTECACKYGDESKTSCHIGIGIIDSIRFHQVAPTREWTLQDRIRID